VAAKKRKATKRKTTRRIKTAATDHNEAAQVLNAALMNARDKRAARAHPIVGPIMKKLGAKGFKQLSAIAQNQTACPCPPHPI
jgi:hypothetical protein